MNIEHAVRVGRLTTVGIGGPARHFARPQSIAELEEEMGAPGFWDDQQHAAAVSTEHSRLTKRLDRYRRLQGEYDDAQLRYLFGDMLRPVVDRRGSARPRVRGRAYIVLRQIYRGARKILGKAVNDSSVQTFYRPPCAGSE